MQGCRCVGTDLGSFRPTPCAPYSSPSGGRSTFPKILSVASFGESCSEVCGACKREDLGGDGDD